MFGVGNKTLLVEMAFTLTIKALIKLERINHCPDIDN